MCFAEVVRYEGEGSEYDLSAGRVLPHQIVDLLVELELVAVEGERPEALSERAVGLVIGGRN